MKEQSVTFPSGSLTLEGLLAKPEGDAVARGGVVGRYSHPLYGGIDVQQRRRCGARGNVEEAIGDAAL